MLLKNLAQISANLNKPVHRISPNDANTIVFAELDEEQKYSVEFNKEIIDVTHRELEVTGFLNSELKWIMEYLCTSERLCLMHI